MVACRRYCETLAVADVWDRVISGVCDSVCVPGGSVCVSALLRENGLSYQHQTWYTYTP